MSKSKLAGLMLVIVALSLMVFWEFWGRENIAYDRILVLKEPLPAHSLIKEEDLTSKRVEYPSENAIKEENMKSLIGMETCQYVAEDVELRMEYFTNPKFATDEELGNGSMALSLDWLLSNPQTLARGDEITVYSNGTKIGEATIGHVRDSSNNEIVFQGSSRENSSGVVSYIEIISDTGILTEIAKMASEGQKFALIAG